MRTISLLPFTKNPSMGLLVRYITEVCNQYLKKEKIKLLITLLMNHSFGQGSISCSNRIQFENYFYEKRSFTEINDIVKSNYVKIKPLTRSLECDWISKSSLPTNVFDTLNAPLPHALDIDDSGGTIHVV